MTGQLLLTSPDSSHVRACLSSAAAPAKLSSERQPVPQATTSSQEELKLIGNPSLVLMKRKREQNTWNTGVFCFGLSLSPIFLPIPLLNFHYFPNFSSHSLSHGHMPSYKSYLERRAARDLSLPKAFVFLKSVVTHTYKTISNSRGWKVFAWYSKEVILKKVNFIPSAE